MTTSALAKTGVEAVIEGLGEFENGMGMMNSLVSGFGKTAKENSGILGVFGNIIDTVGESLRRIGEFVVAGIILEGLKRITSAIRDMIASVIDAAVEFQGLQIQLETLLAGDILESGQVDNFTDALALAVPQAEELFFWIQKTSLQTPFDIADVTRVITMAEAYGFTADEAKGLTGTILDFSAGMNLTDEQMRRIIENFGQMIQQGKVTNTELRDLARGAMVPITPILERMQQNLGLTTKEFEKLRKEGKLEVMPFIQAFTDIVGEEMPGAASRANRTISAVIGNMKDLVQGVVSFNVVKPVLDVVSDKLATILDTLTSGERGEKLLTITSQMGEALASLANVIFGDIDAEGFADTILGVLDMVKGKIIGITEILKSDAGATEKAAGILGLLGLDPALAGKAEDVINNIKSFVDEKIPLIKEKINEVVTFIREDLWPVLESIISWISENKEPIMKFIAGVAVAWTIMKVALAVLIPVALGVLALLALFASPLLLLIATIPILVGLIWAFKDTVGTAFSQVWEIIKYYVKKWIGTAYDALMQLGVLVVRGFVGGFIAEIARAWNTIAPWLNWFVDQIKGLLGISSPSTVFAEIGRQLNEGLAEGIAKSIQLPAKAMDLAVSHVISAGVSGVQGGVTNNSAVTNNFTMTVNSSARTEPIMADFNAMQAMIGAR